MAVTTTITPGDIATASGRPLAGKEGQWYSFIEDAVWLIGKRAEQFPDVELVQADVDFVVKHAVLRHLSNPDDATQVTVSVDDGSTSRIYKSGNGRVSMLDEWWEMLGLVDSSGAFTIVAGGVASPPRYVVPAMRTWPWVGP